MSRFTKRLKNLYMVKKNIDNPPKYLETLQEYLILIGEIGDED